MQYFDTYDAPLGKMILTCDGSHLTAAFFAGQKHGELYLDTDAVQKSLPVLEETKRWLDEYFAGNIPNRLPPIRLEGTTFQKQVWGLLQKIPYGETVSYGQLAKQLCCKSAQAVGGAVGRNPISILVPCHRVVGADGSLTGYAGGVERKEALLKLESSI